MIFIILIHQNLIMGLPFHKAKQLLPLINWGRAYLVKKIILVEIEPAVKKKVFIKNQELFNCHNYDYTNFKQISRWF